MSEELQSATPEGGGDNEAAANKPGKKNDAEPKKEIKTRKIRKWFGLTKNQWRELAGYLILIPWLWYDLFDAHGFGKICFLAASLTVAQGLACSFLKGLKKAIAVWIIFEVLLAGAVWINSKPEPKPHFTLSMQIGDSSNSTVFLTNDFLFRRHMENVGELPNGSFMFHTYVSGCLIIPVQQGESNKVFNIIAQNDSPVTVNDLDAIVGFPKEWQCSFDPKWHKADASLIIPRWKFTATNMQYVAAQSPWVLFPYDTLNFPSITNPCIPEYIGSTFKGGLIELSMRSTGFEDMLAANIVFVPVGTNSFHPFVTLGHFDSDGHIHITPSPKELEEWQQ